MADNRYTNADASFDWSQDAGWSLGHVPDATEDAFVDVIPLSGGIIAKSLNAGTVTTIDATWGTLGVPVAATIDQLIGFTASTPLQGGGATNLAITFTGTNQIAGVTLTANPAFTGTIFSTVACSYQIGISNAITDGGSSTFGAFTFSGVILILGPYTSSSGASFTGASFTCGGLNTGDSISGTIAVTGVDGSIANVVSSSSSITAAVIYGGVYTGHPVVGGIFEIEDGDFSGASSLTINFDGHGISGTGQSITIYGIELPGNAIVNLPLDNYILVVKPGSGQVLFTINIPPISEVLNDTIFGLGATGNYQRPNNVANDTLAKPLIKKDATFGPDGAELGAFAGSGGGEVMIPIAPATVSVAAGVNPTIIQDVSTADNKVSTLSLQVTAVGTGAVSLSIGIRVAASGEIVIVIPTLVNYRRAGSYPIPAGSTTVFTEIPITAEAVDSVVVYATQSALTSQDVTSSGSLA